MLKSPRSIGFAFTFCLLTFIAASAVNGGYFRGWEPSPARGPVFSNATPALWSSVTGTAWLTAANWTGSTVPTVNYIAQFGANPLTTSGIGINMAGATNYGPNNQVVGAIELTPARSTDPITIGDSSTTTSGTLTLNGAPINGVSNVIIRNNSNQILTLQNIQGSAGSRTMAVALGNPTENVINIDGFGEVRISSVITGSEKNLTLAGAGNAQLTLSAVNTYSGVTTIKNGGILTLSAGGSIASSSLIDIQGGGIFDPTPLATPLILANGQGIKASGTTTPGTINTSSTKGLTTAADSPLIFSAYDGTNAPLTVGLTGTLTLQIGNPVTINVANGGTPLNAGQHILIAKTSNSSVGGTAPSGVPTVTGDGICAGCTASTIISGGQLILQINAASTNASISGRVTAANGRGITNSTVSVTGGTLSGPVTVSTDRSGRYSFTDLAAGQTYTVTVNARRFTFNPASRLCTPSDSITNADFTAQ